MTYEGMFDEIDCKFELKRAKKFIKKQSDIILALEKQLEEKENEILLIKDKKEREKMIDVFLGAPIELQVLLSSFILVLVWGIFRN